MLILLIFLGLAAGRPSDLARTEFTKGIPVVSRAIPSQTLASRQSTLSKAKASQEWSRILAEMSLGFTASKLRNWNFFSECGRTHSRAPRIVNGEPAAPGLIPWQVGIGRTASKLSEGALHAPEPTL